MYVCAVFVAFFSNSSKNLFVKSVSCVIWSSKSCILFYLISCSLWMSSCIFWDSLLISFITFFSFVIRVFFSFIRPSWIPFNWARIGFRWSSWYLILSYRSWSVLLSTSSILAWKPAHLFLNMVPSSLIWRFKSSPSFCSSSWNFYWNLFTVSCTSFMHAIVCCLFSAISA